MISRPVPDGAAFGKTLDRAMRRWKSGEPVHREMTWIRFMSGAVACEGLIPEIRWLHDCFDPEHPACPGFARVCGRLAEGISDQSVWLNAALHFTSLRALSVAASPSWFSLSEALALRLLTTEIKGVYAEDIRLPFGAFFIEMPPGLLWWDHALTGRHEVRALSVVEGYAPQVPGGKADTGNNPGRRLLVMCYCEPNERSADPADDNLAYFTVPLFSAEQTLVEMFEADREIVDAHSTPQMLHDDHAINGRFGGLELTNRQLRDLVRQFVVNVLLYLNSPNADVVHEHAKKAQRLKKMKAKAKGKKRGKYKSRVEEVLAERSWLVGSRVTIDRNLERAVAEGKGAGGKLRFKSLVRGHWRKQAYGPKRSLRKLLWIEPHVRGGDLEGPLMGHDYNVKGKKTR